MTTEPNATPAERWLRDKHDGFVVKTVFTHLGEWEVCFSDGTEFLSEQEFVDLKEMMQGK